MVTPSEVPRLLPRRIPDELPLAAVVEVDPRLVLEPEKLQEVHLHLGHLVEEFFHLGQMHDPSIRIDVRDEQAPAGKGCFCPNVQFEKIQVRSPRRQNLLGHEKDCSVALHEIVGRVHRRSFVVTAHDECRMALELHSPQQKPVLLQPIEVGQFRRNRLLHPGVLPGPPYQDKDLLALEPRDLLRRNERRGGSRQCRDIVLDLLSDKPVELPGVGVHHDDALGFSCPNQMALGSIRPERE